MRKRNQLGRSGGPENTKLSQDSVVKNVWDLLSPPRPHTPVPRGSVRAASKVRGGKTSTPPPFYSTFPSCPFWSSRQPTCCLCCRRKIPTLGGRPKCGLRLKVHVCANLR